MKFSVNSGDFLKSLQNISGAIAQSPVLPILETVLFEIADNRLTLTATDLETSMITDVEVMADSDFSVAIPHKIMVDTLKALPAQPVTFNIVSKEADEKEFVVSITSAYGQYKFDGEYAPDFPAVNILDTEGSLVLPCAWLSQGISKTIFATSNDELRPAMTGIYFDIDEKGVVMVATDAHKLVRFTSTDVTSETAASFIAPKKAMNHLKGILPKDGVVTLRYNKANAIFIFGNVTMICRLIDARYPDYNAVIPISNPIEINVNRNDMAKSVKRIDIYSNKTTHQVVLNASDKSLTLSAQDHDFSNEAIEQLPCHCEGEAITIGFNAKFLAEILSIMDGESINIELSTPSRAAILKEGEPTEGQELLMLIMPVMLA